MVRVLIGLRRTIARHQLAGTSTAVLAVTATLVLVTAVATLLTGLLSYPRAVTATDVLALVSLLWTGGRIAQSALSGEPFLRPEIFSLLPLPRRRLGWSLLADRAARPGERARGYRAGRGAGSRDTARTGRCGDRGLRGRPHRRRGQRAVDRGGRDARTGITPGPRHRHRGRRHRHQPAGHVRDHAPGAGVGAAAPVGALAVRPAAPAADRLGPDATAAAARGT